MSDLARLLQQYGYGEQPNALSQDGVSYDTSNVLAGMPKPNALADALRVAGVPQKDEHGFLFSNVGGELKFSPYEAIKNFMAYRAPPGALSTSGDDTPVRHAADVAGWVGLSGLGLNAFGAVPANAVGSAGGKLAGQRITAYHGSPYEFEKFQTPAFFDSSEGIAKQYRRDYGGGDNLNGLGGKEGPQGYYRAHLALDENNQDRQSAIKSLQEAISSPQIPDHFYEKQSFVDRWLNRPKMLTPSGRQALERSKNWDQGGLDYLQSGAPAGKIYEVSIPAPTANYGWDMSQEELIKDAIAKGHKVVTLGSDKVGLGEIIVTDPSVIEILRKYGLVGALGAGSAANGLLPDKSEQ